MFYIDNNNNMHNDYYQYYNVYNNNNIPQFYNFQHLAINVRS